MKMKIGIISFAHMHAYSYARCIKDMPDLELVAVSDENEERGRFAAQQFQAGYFQNYQDLLHADIEAVIVCNENVNHKHAVIAAAEAGKHILCEKPLATNLEDAWEMIEACKKHGVKLQVAFPVRFNPPVKRVKQMIDEGALGRILSMRGTNRGQNPGGWFIDPQLSGGGAILDHTVHVIDLMRWFLNSEVTEVYAETDTKFNDIGVDDCGLLMLEFASGVFASHDPSWSRSLTYPTWGDVTLEIIGTKGMTYMDAFAQHLEVYSDSQNRFSHHFWGSDMDSELIRDFISCIRNDREPSITGLDGLRSMQVALVAYESAAKKQPVALHYQ